MQDATTARRRLGANGPEVYPIALGTMGMSPGVYGHADDNEGIATIHEAIERGVNLIDTGDFYGMGHNETLVGRAVRDRRDKVLLSVKFGAQRAPDGAWVGFDARPSSVKNFLAYSLNRLGVDHIDIYRPARLDPGVPIEETVGAIADMVKRGYVRYIGLSEVGVETIRRARAVHPVSDLQIEYAIVSRSPERAIFPALAEMGIGVTAYGVLSRGLLTGSAPAGRGDFRKHLPRFTGENADRNARLVETLGNIALERGVTTAQMAIAWVLSRGDGIVPVMGARTRAQLAETLGAVDLRLSDAEMARIDRDVPAVAGDRYHPEAMAALDSEK